MLISPSEINKLLSITASNVSNEGKRYFEHSKVKVANFIYNSEKDYIATSYVEGSYVYEVVIKKGSGKIKYKCECPHSKKNPMPCKHIVAAIFNMYINYNEYFEFLEKNKEVKLSEALNIGLPKIEKKREELPKIFNEQVRTFIRNNKLITYYENLENNDKIKEEVNIEPILEIYGLREKNIKVYFKIGKERLYNLKDLFEFSKYMKNEDSYKYGKSLDFVHKVDNFSENSKEIAKYILDYGMQYLYFNDISEYGMNIQKKHREYIDLKYNNLDNFFEIMKNRKIAINGYDFDKRYECITLVEEDPILEFSVIDNENIGLNIINLSKNKYRLYEGRTSIYVLYKDKLYKCSEDFKKNMYPLLNEFEEKRVDCIRIEEEFTTSFCEYLVPKILNKAKIQIDEKINEKYRAEKLSVKVYLDIDEKSNIVANVKFCYFDFEFNPFDEKVNISRNRNKVSETKVMNVFKEYNFLLNHEKSYIFLSSEDDIYRFLTEGINIFMQKFEVLITDKLKNKQMINTKSLNIGIKIENDLLNLNIGNLNLSESELKDIFKRYKLKKKYFRLKDGSFINLENSGIDTLVKISDNLGISEKELAKSNITLPKYRAIYLDSLTKQNNDINWSKDSNFKEIIKDINDVEEMNFKLPSNLNATLRQYQITGYNWLKMLEKYGFGGILADDMGLGKTIQVISILQSAKENKTSKPSIVVCPSSLYINWKKEINRFAPNLNIQIISGSANLRQQLIKDINNFDVIITSYDLLKRDIEYYTKYNFKFSIADEAQYIKNNNTKNAIALKKINADIRFALTGTPIENSLAELWSIFDYIMPGYLYSYKKFKEKYETPIVKDSDIIATQRLQKLVAPFVLRRVKKEVLKELPDKTESMMYSKMEEKQEKLYMSFLSKAREEIEQEFNTNGFEKSRMKVLAIITRLRQICCHPSLFIENYDGGSSKLDQCIQIIEDAVASNHKILLFSGFTSMFSIITRELEKRNIKYEMLTGSTKVDTRIQMVDEFNKSAEIKVFLISLKAGGTGLNLTGADMVIHYDPWWNLSAQNQATDRAYRIGQKNNVQVFKLISENSIEEKIINLQNKKVDLTNAVISEKETFISKMSKEEILDLFDM